MGRAPCCDKANVKRGPWSPEEDAKLKDYIHNYGTGNNWIALPHKAGLKRCGKSCRLRWLNYLRPNIKHGDFSDEEDRIICTLFAAIGSRWSIIAAQLPGRTDNDIKNYWNTKLKKKLMGISNIINPNPQLILSHYPTTILHNTPSPESNNPLLLSSSPFNSGPNYYNAPPSASLSWTGFDTTTSAASSTILQQDGGYNYLVCRGAPEPSYTSSDGSYSNYQYQDQDQPQQYHGCPPNSSSLTSGETEALMGYGLEEIKQLISTTNTAASTISTSQNGDCSNSNSFYFDENNTGGRVMMYYY